MLLVKTRVEKVYRGDKCIGNGLIADEFIPKGTVIWKLNLLVDKVVSVFNLESLNELEKKYLETYAYREGNFLTLCSDDGKYINHAVVPNTADYAGDSTIAIRDIQTGEEITSDYRSFDDDSKNGELDAYL